MIRRYAFAVSLCLTLGACGGGGDSPDALSGTAPDDGALADETLAPPIEEPSLGVDDEPEPGEIGVVVVTPDVSPEPEDIEPGTRLLVGDALLCPTVGETFEFAVTAVDPPPADGTPPASRDVTASVELTSRFGDALELVSVGDGSIALRMNEQDITELDIVLAAESTLTVRVGGFGPDAPADALMKKPVEGGCLYALRLESSMWCGTARLRDGRASLGTGDTVVALDGCAHEAPEGLPVIELAPSGG